ncbi:MAG: serine--tRNA ligase, partial [bacterium]|nr:serine--tRNA ligase [bacterium]
MLDLKLIREKKDWVEAQLRRREPGISLDEIVALDTTRRNLQTANDEMKAKQNAVSKEIGNKKRTNENADALMAEMKELADTIKAQSVDLREYEDALMNKIAELPNLPHESVPTDMDKRNNQVVRVRGE